MQKCTDYLHTLSKGELISILENSQNLLFRTDLEGNIAWIMPSVKYLLGYKCSEMTGDSMMNYCAGNANEIFAKLAASSGRIFNHKMSLRHQNGSLIQYNAAIQYVFSANNEPEFIEYSAFAAQTSAQTEAELQYEKEKSHVTLEAIVEGVITTDSIGNIQFLNSAAERLCGWTNAQAFGLPLNDVFRLTHENEDSSFNCSVSTCCSLHSASPIPERLRLLRRDGSILIVEHTASPILDPSGVMTGTVVVFRDVTNIRRLEKEISFRATHDPLTNVYNRFEFENKLKKMTLEQKGKHTICYIDLDKFKTVNDSCGHLAGDELLKNIVVVMTDRISNNDIFARVGGDEFAVILKDTNLDEAENIGRRIITAIESYRFEWEGKYYQVGCSIGITEIMSEDTDFTAIINRADKSCYVAKKTGGNKIRVFSPDIEENFLDSQWIEKIRAAILNDSILMYVQKGISARKAGADSNYNEILIRMQDTEGNIITPSDFFPAAERYGLLGEIDAWVIKNIFKNLNTAGITAINLSAVSVANPEFADYIIAEADKNNINKTAVCFEISENTAVGDLVSTINFIESLKPHGFLFTLDNVGRGTNSFSYLKNVPVDYFKIDDKLMKNIKNDPVDLTTVVTIHEISKLLGKKTIAIVENQQLLDKTIELGSSFVQGFHINKPEPFLN